MDNEQAKDSGDLDSIPSSLMTGCVTYRWEQTCSVSLPTFCLPCLDMYMLSEARTVSH